MYDQLHTRAFWICLGFSSVAPNFLDLSNPYYAWGVSWIFTISEPLAPVRQIPETASDCTTLTNYVNVNVYSVFLPHSCNNKL